MLAIIMSQKLKFCAQICDYIIHLILLLRVGKNSEKYFRKYIYVLYVPKKFFDNISFKYNY